MFAAPRGWIGVDLGTQAVKLAQVERRNGRLALRAAAIVQRRSPWAAMDSRSTSPRSSEEEIWAAQALGGNFRGRRAVCVAPMAICDLRELTVPTDIAGSLRDAIGEELGAIYGLDSPACEFDFWSSDPADEASAEAQNRVNVLCLRRDWAEQIAWDHTRARLGCEILDGFPLALARAVGLGSTNVGEEPVGALDWGHSTATFCLIVEGQARFARCLPDCGYGAVLDLVAQTLTLSVAEAQQLLTQQGLPDPAAPQRHEVQAIIADIVGGHVAGLMQELQRTLAYVGSRNPGQPLARLYLFGGGATLRNIDRWLGEQLAMPTSLWSIGDLQPASSPAAGVPLEMLGPAIACSCLAWDRP